MSILFRLGFIVVLCAIVSLGGRGIPLVGPTTAFGAEASLEDLERRIAELERIIRELKVTQQQDPDGRIEDLERQIEGLTRELERLRLGEAAEVDATAGNDRELSITGLGASASKIYRKDSGVSIGGYGEMVYTSPMDEDEAGNAVNRTAELDFLRAILYFGYRFNDKWLLNSEFEFEHASTSRSGSASVEFAYIDYMHSEAFNLRFGMLLAPIGFINEFHEPTTFYSVNRPNIENRIIPTTWRENGLGTYGTFETISWRLYLLNGLDGKEFDASGLRGGRQKGGDALAEDFGFAGRFDWEPTPGVIAGFSFYLGDSAQDFQPSTVNLSTGLYSGHLEATFFGVRVRALGAMATIDDAKEFNDAMVAMGNASPDLAERMLGGYLEIGYDIFSAVGVGNQALIPFVRYEAWNTQETMPEGYEALEDNSRYDASQITVGIAYQPIPQLIFKGDYQINSTEAETGVDQVNLGVGYLF